MDEFVFILFYIFYDDYLAFLSLHGASGNDFKCGLSRYFFFRLSLSFSLEEASRVGRFNDTVLASAIHIGDVLKAWRAYHL